MKFLRLREEYIIWWDPTPAPSICTHPSSKPRPLQSYMMCSNPNLYVCAENFYIT